MERPVARSHRSGDFSYGLAMSSRLPVIELGFCHALLAAGLLSAGAAYRSGDPSGLQYLLLWVGATFIGVAGAVLVCVRALGGRVPGVTWLWTGLALAVAFYPYWLGWGFDSRRLDPIGAWSVTGLLLGQLTLIAAYVVRRWQGRGAAT